MNSENKNYILALYKSDFSRAIRKKQKGCCNYRKVKNYNCSNDHYATSVSYLQMQNLSDNWIVHFSDNFEELEQIICLEML